MNTIEFLDETVRNFRLSFRTLRRSPGFALTAVLVLALGLGASTAMFSALDRILFRPLPYADADRLVNLGWTMPLGPGPGQTQTRLYSRGYRQRWKPAPEPFTAVTTIAGAVETCDITEQQPERLHCAKVEDNFLETLGVRPTLGRAFTPEDDARGAPPVAIISHDVWTRRFRADPGALGRTIELNGKPIPVIGVLPAGFAVPGVEADILRPQQIYPIDPGVQGGSLLTAFGRLKQGVTPEQAKAAIAPIIADDAKDLPRMEPNHHGTLSGPGCWRPQIQAQAILVHRPASGQRISDFGDHWPERLPGPRTVTERVTDACPRRRLHRRLKPIGAGGRGAVAKTLECDDAR